ncbi:MAG: hypothetical protein ACR2PG_05950 [Hyphomicrobiaceae bacterium]
MSGEELSAALHALSIAKKRLEDEGRFDAARTIDRLAGQIATTHQWPTDDGPASEDE